MSSKLNRDEFDARANRSNVVGLGLVSLFNDLSSEVISRILPLYILAVVGSSFIGVGVVEALSESTSIFGKLVSGYYSDRLHKRKPIVMFGYALSVLSRPFLVVTPTLAGVSAARFFDRVGKAVRTPARDAFIADLSHEKNRGLNFGINRALDTLGAVLGLAAVVIYLNNTTGPAESHMRFIMIAAAAMGVLALFVLAFFVREGRPAGAKKTSVKPRISYRALDSRLRQYLAIAALFALANSSDAFLIVRAKEFGFSLKEILIILIGFNLAPTLLSIKLSKLSDTLGRKLMLMIGWGVYVVSYFFFGLKSLSPQVFYSAMIFYGLYYSFTEGVEKAMVADFETGDRKGLAYGWLGLVQGICVIPANLVFAYFYQLKGASWAFWLSGGFALAGVASLSLFKPHPMGRT